MSDQAAEGSDRLRARARWKLIDGVGRYLRIRQFLHWPASEAHRQRLIDWLIRRSDPETLPPK